MTHEWDYSSKMVLNIDGQQLEWVLVLYAYETIFIKKELTGNISRNFNANSEVVFIGKLQTNIFERLYLFSISANVNNSCWEPQLCWIEVQHFRMLLLYFPLFSLCCFIRFGQHLFKSNFWFTLYLLCNTR